MYRNMPPWGIFALPEDFVMVKTDSGKMGMFYVESERMNKMTVKKGQ